MKSIIQVKLSSMSASIWKLPAASRVANPCSALHGFATLEAAGSFQIDADIDDSFTWMIDFIDHRLRSMTVEHSASSP